MHTDDLIATFRSRQQASAFRMNLTRAGVKSEMISTPAVLARGCGVSVRFAREDLPLAQRYGGAYHMTAFDGYFTYDAEKRRFVRL